MLIGKDWTEKLRLPSSAFVKACETESISLSLVWNIYKINYVHELNIHNLT